MEEELRERLEMHFDMEKLKSFVGEVAAYEIELDNPDYQLSFESRGFLLNFLAEELAKAGFSVEK